MTTETIEMRKLIASDGCVLTNGESYSKTVILGKFDSPENWKEIPEEDVPEGILIG
ncbi:MAG: hypothetical protein KBT27_06630 [Prevotellaceae bacterium]|nr:hypothetical protein [Candidatus Faecinaster equi]